MSSNEEEIKILEKKLSLLKQIKELEGQITPQTSTQGPSPEQVEAQKRAREEELRRELAKLSPPEALIVLLKKKDLEKFGPFRD